MKLSTLFPLALYITGCLALPARIQNAVPVPVSQDPSPPRPFPAGHIVEFKDPSPPRPFPKYPLEGGNPLGERDPSALSRFPTDEENVALDPSPPRPFPAGRIVEVKDPSPPRPFPKYPLEGGNPLEEREPSALSRFPTDEENVALDPSPPRPFPAGHIVEDKDPSPPRPFPTKYPLESLEERVPSALSRFPTDEENVALDPSPPRPFPAGRIVDGNSPSPPMEERDPRAPHKLVALESDPSPPRPFPKYPLEGGNPLEKRDPLSRFPTDGEKEAADPSPPRPFPAGRIVEVKDSSPSDIIEPRTPSPLLRTPEGPEAEANDPSPPRPFPAGHIVEVQGPASSGTIEPRSPSPLLRNAEGPEAEANDPSPPRPFPAGHIVEEQGPPSSGTMEPRSPTPLLRNAEGSEAEANDPSPPRPFPAGHPVDTEPRADEPPPHRGHGGYFPPSNPPVLEPTAPPMEADRTRKRCSCPPHFPDCCSRHSTLTRWILPAPHTTEGPVPGHTAIATATATSAVAAAVYAPLPTPCTITLTANDFHHPDTTGTSTAYNATVTSTRTVHCGGCSLTVMTVDTGNGPVVATSRPTVTDAATATAYATVCRPWDSDGDLRTLSFH